MPDLMRDDVQFVSIISFVWLSKKYIQFVMIFFSILAQNCFLHSCPLFSTLIFMMFTNGANKFLHKKHLYKEGLWFAMVSNMFLPGILNNILHACMCERFKKT
jgi:hypothetical protein